MPDELVDWAAQKAARMVKADFRTALAAEAQRLASTLSRYAPVRSGFLRRSFHSAGKQVRSADYARIVSEGGVIRAKRGRMLTIPVPGYVPGPDYVTVSDRSGGQAIFRRGTYELWAIRRREVIVRGSGYLTRATQDFLRSRGPVLAEAEKALISKVRR